MRWYTWSVLIALTGIAATPAVGCRIYMPAADLSVIHDKLPQTLPPDAFVADVQFEHPDRGWSELFKGARARVSQIIQGDYSGEVVIVRDGGIRITCYDPIRSGGAGLIIGKPIGFENGVLVIQPIFASPQLSR